MKTDIRDKAPNQGEQILRNSDVFSEEASSERQKFRKEFKKNFFEGLDKRFYLILLLSFIVHVSVVLYLRNKFPPKIDSGVITRIQKQFANLLLEKGTTLSYEEWPVLEKRLDTKVITGMTKWMETFVTKVMEKTEEPPAVEPERPVLKPRETRTPPIEMLAEAREKAARARRRSRESITSEMSSVGLLGLITSGSGSIDYEYIEDLLELASRSTNHLARVLAKLNALKVPRRSADYYSRMRAKRGLYSDFGELKGGKIYADKDVKKVIANMEPLKPAETTPIARNVSYEKVPSYLDKLRRNGADGKTRAPKDVSNVVMSHNRAIQDCYKQELKRNPNLKGKIVVRFTVNPEGRVVSATIVSSTINNPQMEECILNRIRKWNDFGYCDPSIGNIAYKQVYNFGY